MKKAVVKRFFRGFIKKYGMRNIKNDDKIIWILNNIRDDI